MHFAVGMTCSGAAAAGVCLVVRRGWRWIGPVMSVGGIWAILPDLPRMFREDFPHLPLASALGSKSLERSLNDWGNLFFLHQMLDTQPHEYALHGLLIILLLYNLVMLSLMWLPKRRRGGPRRLYEPRS